MLYSLVLYQPCSGAILLYFAGKRRKVRRKKVTSAGKKGKTASKGTKGKKRKVRRTMSRRKQVGLQYFLSTVFHSVSLYI